MNIEPLYELKERLNTSAVAGISLIPEDFRLKRAIEQIEPLAKAAPIFAKIYQGALHILEVPAEQRANALLDELALLDAVLVTQAAAGIDGTLSAINKGMHERVITEIPYSKAAPAMEALTTTGSGHYSFLIELHKESPESFRDFRLRLALVEGLGTGYYELAGKIENWLSEEDESILPYLKRGFQGDGRKEMVRRVHIVEKIAGAKENNWYIAMLETAKKEVRETLIYALRHDKNNEALLMDLIKTEKSGGKKAAIWALTRMESEEVYEYFRKQLGTSGLNSDALVVQRRAKTIWEDGYFYLSKSDQISNLVADQINKKLDFLEEQVKNGTVLLEFEERQRISQMFYTMIGKTTDAMIAVFKRLVKTKVFDEIKNKESAKEKLTLPEWDNASFASRNAGRVYDLKYLDRLLMESILLTKSPKLFQLAEELYQEYQEEFLISALVVALLSKEGDAVFSEFSHYLVQDGKRENTNKKAGRLGIMGAFALLSYNKTANKYVLNYEFRDACFGETITIREPIFGEFDSHWLELLTSEKIKKDGTFWRGIFYHSRFDIGQMASWDSVLEQLIQPNNQENCTLLGKYFSNRALYGKKGKFSDHFEAVRKCHMNFKPEVLIDYMKQHKGKMYLWEFLRLIKEIPMVREDKLFAIEEIRGMAEKKEISLEWNEEYYLQHFNEL